MSDPAARPILAEAIQNTAHTDPDIEGAMLLGWVVLAEWVAPTGDRWLSRVDGGSHGHALPEWTREGMLYNALQGHGFARQTEEDEDEEDD